MLIRRTLNHAYLRTCTHRTFMMLPMPMVIPPPKSKNVDYYPDPSTIKAMVKDDIIRGGDDFGFPRYDKYVYGLKTRNDIYNLQDLNNLINNDVERWKPRDKQMKRIQIRESMVMIAGSTLLGGATGSLSAIVFMSNINDKMDIVNIAIGLSTGSISVGFLLLNCYIIRNLIYTMRYSTPENMMTYFRETYNEAFEDAHKLYQS